MPQTISYPGRPDIELPDPPKFTQGTTQNVLVITDSGRFKFEEELLGAVGPRELRLKPQVVNFCKSDIDLSKKWDQHPRKSSIVRGPGGDDLTWLEDCPSYRPGELSVSPGHELVLLLVAVGEEIDLEVYPHLKVGEFYTCQTDLHGFIVLDQNGKEQRAAIGYTFHGGLREWLDLPVEVVAHNLIPLGEAEMFAASTLEPTACWEHAFTHPIAHRRPANGDRILVICEEQNPPGLDALLKGLSDIEVKRNTASTIDSSSSFEAGATQIIYYGHRASEIESLFPKLATGGVLNIVTGGHSIDREVETDLGAIHYQAWVIIGTNESEPQEAYGAIPETLEPSEGDDVLIWGGRGPMGRSVLCRMIYSDSPPSSICATTSQPQHLNQLAEAARERGIKFTACSTADVEGRFNHVLVIAPHASAAKEAVGHATPEATINLFSGLKGADGLIRLPLQTLCVSGKAFMHGSSGSLREDLERVVLRLPGLEYDPATVIGAFTSLDGTPEAFELLAGDPPGKICYLAELPLGLGLVPSLEAMAERAPEFRAALELSDGVFDFYTRCALLADCRKGNIRLD